MFLWYDATEAGGLRAARRLLALIVAVLPTTAGCGRDTTTPAPLAAARSAERPAPDQPVDIPTQVLPATAPPVLTAVSSGPPATAAQKRSLTEPASAPAPPDAPPPVTAPPAAPLPPDSPPPSTADVVARVEPSVAVIKGDDGHGTGFVVRPGVIATNAHVVRDELEESLEVRFPSAPEGRRGPYSARVLEVRADRDLAFLKVATDLPALELADHYRFRKGEDVLIIGSPGVGPGVLIENAVTRGLLSSRIELEGQRFYQLSAAVNPGNSGGPVLDARGCVIGVVTRKAAEQEALSFSIPIEDVRAALDELARRPAEPAVEANAAGAPLLRYRMAPGQTHVFAIDVTLGAEPEREVWVATSVYTAVPGEPRRLHLRHHGVLEHHSPPPLAGSRRQTSGPSRVTIDTRGVVHESGDADELPLLGDLTALPFDPLASGREGTWRVERELVLRSRNTTLVPGAGGLASRLSPFGRFGPGRRLDPRSRFGPGFPRMPGSVSPFGGFGLAIPQPEAVVTVVELPAHEQTDYRAMPARAASATVTITRRHTLETLERSGAGSRLGLTGQGEIQFDTKLGWPRQVTFDGTITERAEGRPPTRTPLTYRVRLLEGSARDRAVSELAPGRSPRSTDPPTSGSTADGSSGPLLPPSFMGDDRDGFRDVAPKDGVLVGVRVRFIQAFGGSMIGALQPIYRVGRITANGQWHGQAMGPASTVLARDGYVVGALSTRTGLILNGFAFTFVRQKGDTIDTGDRYTSPWIGDDQGGGPASVDAQGRRVIGIHGRSEREMRALGLVVAD